MTQTPTGAQRFADDAHRYRLDSRLASGGMGEVWRGTDTTLGREVAIKLLRHEYADDPGFRARFETEARNAAALHHPGVASVFDVGEALEPGRADGSGLPRPYLVMEYVDGKPLSTLLAPGRGLSADAVRDLLAQAADALGVAHRAGIVHRDVKPANLMVTTDRQVKVTDFGIARAADALALTGTGMVMGTPSYLSPEQARGNPATPASDVYALGVVGFECLVGHRPFMADSPVATALAHLQQPVPPLPDGVPVDLDRVITRALAKDPADRYPDGAALAAALRGGTVADPADQQTTRVVTPVVVPVDPPTQVLATPPAAPPVARAVVEERTDLVEPPPPDSHTTAWVGLVALLAALAAIAVVVALLVADNNDDDPGTTPSRRPTSTAPTKPSPSAPTEATSTPPQTINLDEGDYLGRDIQDVAGELVKMGLDVDPQSVDNPGDETAGAVTGVDPRRDLLPGDTVTVTYYADPEPETEPTTTPPAESPSPPTESSSTPTAEVTEETGLPTGLPTDGGSDDPGGEGRVVSSPVGTPVTTPARTP